MQIPIGQINDGPAFSLPLDLVTKTIAILARKGRGKSYLASVVVEGLLDAGQVPVIIDPTGAWWGLKSSADGRQPAYPMVVFGGEHQDLPIEETAGEATARAIVEQRFPAIIDLSGMRKAQVKRFVTAFLETLYRLNKLPMMLVVDEADDICPQKPFGDEAQMVGALEDVVKRGRKKGIGCMLITQRPADLAKQVLTQCEMLVAMGVSHPLDIKAVMEWVNVHADRGTAQQMVESLPGLPVGTAWFWEPGADIFCRVAVSRRKTFDSGATPKAGQVAVVPKQMAQADLVKIGGEIMASVQRAKDNDPRALREKLSRVERELYDARAEAEENKMAHMDMAKVAPVPIRYDVHVPVIGDSERRLFGEIKTLMEEGRERTFHCEKLLDALNADLKRRLDKWDADKVAVDAQIAKTTAAAPVERENEIARRRTLPIHVQAQMRHAERASADPAAAIGEGERIILSACFQHVDGCTREQLTVLTGYKKSSRDTYLQRLKSKNLVQQIGERIISTPEGRGALGPDVMPLPTGARLREHWLERLPEGEGRILEVLLKAHGAEVHREHLSDQTGYKKSSRDTYIQRLSARELVTTTRDGVRASKILF